jgi:hypothetical protein
MFGVFKSREQKAIDKFWKSDLGQRLVSHNADYFGPGAVWGDFSPEGKQKFNGWLLERILGVLNSSDSFAAMRLELAAMTSCHAQLLVLLRGPISDWMKSRYFSVQLYKHVRQCAPYCKELAEEIWRSPDGTDDDLYNYAQQRSIYYNFVLNEINLLRYEFDDFAGGDDRDWLRPFSKSMLIWHEDVYRSKIGLPTLFEDKIIKALPHSNFFNLVHDGVRNPLFEWEAKFGKHELAC